MLELLYADPVAGTGTSTSLAAITNYRILPMSAGATWGVVYMNTGSTALSASVISVNTGTVTSTLSTVASFLATGTAVEPFNGGDMIVAGSKLIFLTNSTAGQLINILTDASGTASAGTAIAAPTITNGIANAISASGNNARFIMAASGGSVLFNVDYSGASAVLTTVQKLVVASNGIATLNASLFSGSRNPGLSIGTQTYVLGNQQNEVGSRLVRIIGTVMDTPTTPFNAFDIFGIGSGAQAPGTRTNEGWAYTANLAGSNSIGQLSRVESVT